jgi:hypothetical protein
MIGTWATVSADGAMAANRHGLGRVFNEVPQLYDQVRRDTPMTVRGPRLYHPHDEESLAPEVGCGTGQATPAGGGRM